MHRTLWRTVGALAYLAGAACSEPLGPGELAGTYGWRGSITILLPTDETVRVVADTFVLRADGLGVRQTYTEPQESGVAVEPLELTETTFDFRVEGQAVGFSWHCPADAACAAMLLPRTWYDLQGTDAFISRESPALHYLRAADASASFR